MKRYFLLAAAALLLSGAHASAESVYNRGNSGDAETLDPHKVSTVQEANIMFEMFEGLVEYDMNANVIPGVAESWTASPDGLVYTFKLRPDALWSNGEPVTADDFVYSWQRIENPATGSAYSQILYPIKNAEEINSGKLPPEQLGVRAIDQRTLEVTLKGPTPYFINALTHQAFYPVNRDVVEKFGQSWTKPENIVSNGAFKCVENVPNDHIKLVKDPKFHDAASVKLDVVNYIAFEDRNAALKRFEAGEIDSYDDVPTEQLSYIRDKLKGQFFTGPYLGLYYYTIRTDKAPWNNPKLRRALSLMIDRDYIAEKIWGGTMIPAYSIVPPGMKGYTPSFADYKDQSQLDREDEAKKIMTELGYGPGHPLKLEIRYNTGENHKNTAVAIANMFKPFGIETSMLNTDGKTHYAYLRDGGDYDLARAAWIADFKDPQSFMELMQTGEGHNYAKYSNKEFDDLIHKAAIEPDAEKRMQYLAQAEKIAVNDLPMIPIVYYSYHTLVSKRLHGFAQNIMDIHPSRWISKE